MGGPGSGQWYRWNKKDTTEANKRIDIRYLKKQGYLVPGYRGTLSWNCNGKPSGWIQFATLQDAIILEYRFRRNGGEWQDVNQRITITRTACHYGGDRPWFLCPRCNCRIAILYCADMLFLCRHCGDLTYRCQQETPMFRLLRQGTKNSRRIGWSRGIG